jgi:hypothetical protein
MTYSPIAIFGLHDNFYCLNLLLLHPIAFFQEMDFRMEEKKRPFYGNEPYLNPADESY